jgi:DNA-binding response OmpR family regulator
MEFAGAAGDIDTLKELAKSSQPDLALVEWELLGAWPKGSLAAIKESGSATVIVLSCCLDRSVPLDSGADYYVSKIEKPERLIGVIQDIRGHFDAGSAKTIPAK